MKRFKEIYRIGHSYSWLNAKFRIFIYVLFIHFAIISCYKTDAVTSGDSGLNVSVNFYSTDNLNEKAGYITPDLKNSLLTISDTSGNILYSRSYSTIELSNGINIIAPLYYGPRIIRFVAENTSTAEIAGFSGYPEYDASISSNFFMKFEAGPDTIILDGTPKTIELLAKLLNTTGIFLFEPPLADFNSSNHKYVYSVKYPNLPDNLAIAVNNLAPDSITAHFSVETMIFDSADSIDYKNPEIVYHGTLWYKDIKYHRWSLHNPFSNNAISNKWDIKDHQTVEGCSGEFILGPDSSCYWSTPVHALDDRLKVEYLKSAKIKDGAGYVFGGNGKEKELSANNDTNYDSEAILISKWPCALINSTDEELVITGIKREYYIDNQYSSTVEIKLNNENVSADNPVIINSGFLGNIKVSY